MGNQGPQEDQTRAATGTWPWAQQPAWSTFRLEHLWGCDTRQTAALAERGVTSRAVLLQGVNPALTHRCPSGFPEAPHACWAAFHHPTGFLFTLIHFILSDWFLMRNLANPVLVVLSPDP